MVFVICYEIIKCGTGVPQLLSQGVIANELEERWMFDNTSHIEQRTITTYCIQTLLQV